MGKAQWYRIDVHMDIPSREYETIDIGLEANSYKEACDEAIEMVMSEEKLTEDQRKYLFLGLVTEPH